MSIFVLGRSRTGKTPFARGAAKFLGARPISASEWVRSRFPSDGYTDRAAFIQAITKFSQQQLKENPLACVEYIRSRYDLNDFSVVEGIRNPHDFIHLFDPRRDLAVFLEHDGNQLPETELEKGIPIIRDYLSYLTTNGLLEASHVMSYRFKEFYSAPGARGGPISDAARSSSSVWEVDSLETAIDDFCLVALDRLLLPARRSQPRADHHIHADIKPFNCNVRLEYLYDMDQSYAGQFRPCTVFAVSSYKGESPTFKILLADGTVFSYVPPSALVDPAGSSEPQLDLRDLVYHNCPAGDFSLNVFAGLQGPVNAFFKSRNLWLEGSYVLTIDWYVGNDLLHLIALNNGQYCFLPHHKLKFHKGAKQFEPYRKMHSTWKVGDVQAEKQPATPDSTSPPSQDQAAK
jgi:hypothetical protein